MWHQVFLTVDQRDRLQIKSQHSKSWRLAICGNPGSLWIGLQASEWPSSKMPVMFLAPPGRAFEIQQHALLFREFPSERDRNGVTPRTGTARESRRAGNRQVLTAVIACPCERRRAS